MDGTAIYGVAVHDRDTITEYILTRTLSDAIVAAEALAAHHPARVVRVYDANLRVLLEYPQVGE